ncbi:hypothetical protein [Sphingomonas sp. DC1100-1]|uniref:hypothetical protein n=1 Tax=unclassified Sphingomonas TaxID=196159 RepID=UPI003CED61ED
MLKRFTFGAYAPDLPPADQLIVAKNVYPASTGYLPVGSFNAITPALPGITGGSAFVSSKGEASFLGGDRNSLNRFSGGTWAPLQVALTANRWRFAQFGDNVISVYGGAPISYDLVAGTSAFLAGSPPPADMVATVRDFVVLAGDPDHILTVTWSGINNSAFWPATDPTNPDQQQSDSQDMLDGGEVMGLAGGEYGIVLQRNAVKRMSYEGGDLIFRFDEIASNVGCMAKGSVAQAGRLVFFLSERGFMLCDGNDVSPIGEELVNATFFRAYSRQDIIAGIYAAVDPARHLVMWSMPGTPGQLWLYNWVLKRWATIETNVRLIFSGFTANISLDAIDARYGNLDAVPVSLDDPLFSGGNPLFLIARTDGIVGTLSGTPLTATLTTARMELTSGRTRIRTVRPLTDANVVSVTIQGRPRAGSVPLVEQANDMRRNGEVPMRVNAQQIVVSVQIADLWTYAQGFELDYENGGMR